MRTPWDSRLQGRADAPPAPSTPPPAANAFAAKAGSFRPTWLPSHIKAVDLARPPVLLAEGVDDTYEGHHSHEILAALVSHAQQQAKLDKEHAHLGEADRTSQGHASSEVADAFVKYAQQHQAQGMPSQKHIDQLLAAGGGGAGKAGGGAAAAPAALLATAGGAAGGASVGASLAATATTATAASTFSFAAQVQSLYWARVIYCIFWIVSGLVLLFFGYASLFWLNKLGARRATATEALTGVRPKKGGSRAAVLGGGVGGALMGFLFLSFLATVIQNAVVADEGKTPPSAAAYFAIWLLPGLAGAALGGHWAWAARAMSGPAAGACATLVLTAMFGVHTLLVRSILFAILTTLLTAPVLLPARRPPRTNAVQVATLALNTSVVGVVTFLDGVALFAQPRESSAAWLDLWLLLFARDGTPVQAASVSAWGTSAFKGYIAGAVLGALVGVAFEMLLHRHAGEDPDAEFNSYLGAFTERLRNADAAAGGGGGGGGKAEAGMLLPGSFEAERRAGLFQPSPTPWQRMRELFDAARATTGARTGGGGGAPASYGNLGVGGGGGGASASHAALTELPMGAGGGVGTRARSKRRTAAAKRQRSGRTARGVPARFESLSGRDADDDDDVEYACGAPKRLDGVDEGGDEGEEGASSWDGSDSDSDATDVASMADHKADKAAAAARGYAGQADAKKLGASEATSPLTAMALSTYALPGSYVASSLPKPPSQQLAAPSATAADEPLTDSKLSGTTARGSDVAAAAPPADKSNEGAAEVAETEVQRPVTVYRDKEVAPAQRVNRAAAAAAAAEDAPALPPPGYRASLSAPNAAAATVPATPSLLNAISRIQQAQAQARAWQAAQEARGADASPYGGGGGGGGPATMAAAEAATKKGKK